MGKPLHGHTAKGNKSPTYISWMNMIGRCTLEDPSYKHYKEKKITICNRWRIFTNFLEDMGERPKGKTLDRKDNNGNYEPSNCRWATKKEQANNCSTNRRFLYKGVWRTVSELADIAGCPRSRMDWRLYISPDPWTVEEAVEIQRWVRRQN